MNNSNDNKKNWKISVGSPNKDTNAIESTSTRPVTRQLSQNKRPSRSDSQTVDDTPVPAPAANLSKKERKRYGIKLKKKRIVESAGFDVSDEKIVEGDLVWYMSDPPVGIQSNSTNIT